jgi:hypothetical protein
MKRRVALSAVMFFLVFCIISVPLSLTAETAVILKGRTITQGGLDPLVILPDGTVIDSTVLTKGFWNLGFAHDELLVYVPSTHEFLRFNQSPAALLSNLLSKPEIYNLLVYDPAMRKLMKYNDYTVAVGMTSPTIQTVLDVRGTILVLIEAYKFTDFEGVNKPPVAVCKDATVNADTNCQAIASIDNGSYDPDGDHITIAQDPPGPYNLGSTGVTLTVTDSSGVSDSCIGTVTVVTPKGDLDKDCDIDQNDLNIILSYRNQPASNCPECDLDGDGKITALDSRKLVLLCTRPRCATK